MNEGKVAGYYCLEWLDRQSCMVEKITTFEDEVVALPNARLTPRSTDYANSATQLRMMTSHTSLKFSFYLFLGRIR